MQEETNEEINDEELLAETDSVESGEETIEETEPENPFEQFGLSAELLKAVKEVGYETPSPIQLKTIPVLLSGKDIVGQAQTGTGKTAAFALPALHKLEVDNRKVQVLVLVPTRELAIQVAEAFHTYAKFVGNVRVLPVYGGQAISQQIKHLRSGVQIIVGTPGRVMDHMRRETIDISKLKMVILDEADEMLRMGFQEDVEWILAHTPETRQTALFSATIPRQIRRLAEKYLNEPVNIEIERKTLTVPNIKQFYINVTENQKTDALTRLLEMETATGEAVLIFHRTKIGADSLTNKLQARGYAAEAMHGDLNQNQREALIKRLRDGRVEIVVATDVAARGLDVERISSVINYDMPGDTESYVHRIGRTGRAGRDGTAVLFVTPRQQRMKREIEQYTKQEIKPMKLPTQADVASRRIAVFKERILKTLKDEELDLYLKLIEELAEESGCDMSEIAAASAFLSAGDKPLEVAVEPKAEYLSFSEDNMVRLFVDVGRNHRIGPADIVGAIANEGGVPGKGIGAIDVYDRFTLVDVPSEFVGQVLDAMSETRIRGNNANIRLASQDDSIREAQKSRSEQKSRNTWDKPPRREPEGKSRFAANKFDDRPPRRQSEPKSSFVAAAKRFDEKPPRRSDEAKSRFAEELDQSIEKPRRSAKPINTFAAPFDNTTSEKPPRKPSVRGKLTAPFNLPDDRPRRKTTTDFDKPTTRPRRTAPSDSDFTPDRPPRKAKPENAFTARFGNSTGKPDRKSASAKGKGKKKVAASKGKKKVKR
ncbi:MAG: DEAD/DEAH box helicase [Pyrinomonadaceae bacterium]|nr:DEAD/DEAH box helicase [Pyrinomonadaceae bacterium]